MIECLLASVVLAFSVTAGVYAVSAARQQESFVQQQEIALHLIDELMQRVVAAGYGVADPANVADTFDEYSDAVSADGEPVANGSLGAYSRTVAVQSQAELSLGLGGDLRVVTVTVTAPSGQMWHRRQLLATK